MFDFNIYDEFYNILEQVPEGYVTTYGDIAIALGDLIAARAVGVMLSENKDPNRYPCHRVVNADGTLGGFTHPLGITEKIRRLEKDGIKVVNGRVEDFETVRFKDFKSNFPLKKFREWAKTLKLGNAEMPQDCMRAIDINYLGDLGIGVGVSFENPITFDISIMKVTSPYIPNYLYLREGKIFESLVRKDCLNIIDGNGILHRDRRGVATIVGINKNVQTLGMAKSLLTGIVKDNKVFLGNIEVGRIAGKYIISLGNGVHVEEALKKVMESKYFPQTKYPDRIGRRLKNEILSHGDSL